MSVESVRLTIDQQRVHQFWDGITQTSPLFLIDMAAAAMRGQTTREFDRVAGLLHLIHPALRLILGPGDGHRPEIVISAGGMKDAFPAARTVTDTASDGIRERFFVSFLHPPAPFPAELRVQVSPTREMSPTDIYFSATPSRKKKTRMDLTLHVPGWFDALPSTSVANERFASNALVLLDHLCGEWAVEMQIAGISWQSTRSIGNLPTLLDLPAHLALSSGR